ncbi:MAG: hypothetical protein U5K77_01870 [Candidatus Saccharibacteria bacterium]|nr:hypothetical protein [Candidatus Saccharibacteria bacterium]
MTKSTSKTQKEQESKPNMKRTLLIAVPLVILLLLIGNFVFNQIQISEERAKFDHAKEQLAELSSTISSIYNIDIMTPSSYCHYDSHKEGRGPLNCSVSFELKTGVNDYLDANRMVNQLDKFIDEQDDTIVRTSELYYLAADDAFQPLNSHQNKASVGFTFKNNPEIRVAMRFTHATQNYQDEEETLTTTLTYTQRALTEHFPVR